MTKMRLTTLNLDQDCLDILGTAKNKSAKARECILKYHDVVEQKDFYEELYTTYVAALRQLCEHLAEHVDSKIDMQDFLAWYMDETNLAVMKMDEAGYLKDALAAAAIRHVKP